MTPVLCLNCGKARSEHYTHLLDDASKLYCHKYSTATWSPPLDESAIEQRTVEAIELVAEVERLRAEISTWNGLGRDVNDAINRAGIHCAVTFAEGIDMITKQRDDLRGLINTPRTDEFFAAVRHEAAHQIDRWGVEHDAGKRREDWITLLVYLVGKATKAHYDADTEKLKHHVVTVAAVCLNWLRAENGESNAMRPGVACADEGDE